MVGGSASNLRAQAKASAPCQRAEQRAQRRGPPRRGIRRPPVRLSGYVSASPVERGEIVRRKLTLPPPAFSNASTAVAPPIAPKAAPVAVSAIFLL